MKKAFLLSFFLGGMALFAADAYRIDLYKPLNVNGTELKAGSCKIEILDNKVVFKQGKKTAELPATIEHGQQKYISTSVMAGDDREPEEIRISGTTTKITFAKADAGSPAAVASGSK
ncbi:MAG TPA: hypothetical protein VHD76_12110 [Bryobacteraceae bacterium]|jgi:hypothetical protein|nr:hypothetical protein [Bryobacteraceae bacterium]